MNKKTLIKELNKYNDKATRDKATHKLRVAFDKYQFYNLIPLILNIYQDIEQLNIKQDNKHINKNKIWDSILGIITKEKANQKTYYYIHNDKVVNYDNPPLTKHYKPYLIFMVALIDYFNEALTNNNLRLSQFKRDKLDYLYCYLNNEIELIEEQEEYIKDMKQHQEYIKQKKGKDKANENIK